MQNKINLDFIDTQIDTSEQVFNDFFSEAFKHAPTGLSESNFEDLLRHTIEDPQHIDFLVSKFKDIDLNGDGVIDEQEIKQML